MATADAEFGCYGGFLFQSRRAGRLSRAEAVAAANARGVRVTTALLVRHEQRRGRLEETPVIAACFGLDPAFLADLFVRDRDWTPPSGWGRP